MRELKPEKQLAGVAARYGLAALARPFTLCLHCNAALEALDRRAVAGRVPENILILHEAFSSCPACHRVYWPGSHYERMRLALKPIFSPA